MAAYGLFSELPVDCSFGRSKGAQASHTQILKKQEEAIHQLCLARRPAAHLAHLLSQAWLAGRADFGSRSHSPAACLSYCTCFFSQYVVAGVAQGRRGAVTAPGNKRDFFPRQGIDPSRSAHGEEKERSEGFSRHFPGRGTQFLLAPAACFATQGFGVRKISLGNTARHRSTDGKALRRPPMKSAWLLEGPCADAAK
jgi:hypothetical protein